MIRRAIPAVLLVTACSQAPAPNVTPDVTVVPEPVANVRVAPSEQPVAPGDCPEASRRAAARPDLPVDRLPSPVSMKPPPLQKPPKSALRKDGSAEVKVDILVDTLGRPDLKTFTVVTSSSPWLAANVKSVIGKWKFEPAQLAGCKVPRIYHFMASQPARGKGAE